MDKFASQTLADFTAQAASADGGLRCGGVAALAGALAAAAGARRLWLTHYSAAVTDPGPGLAAAAAAFPGAEAGADGKRAALRFEE